MVQLITIVIPMFRESERAPRTLAEIESFISKHPDIISKVILVDDGSAEKIADKTVERALRFMTRIPLHVECLAKNSGKWAAINRGIKLAETDAILILDADSSASIWELEKLLQYKRSLLVSRISIFGTRFHKDSIVEGKSLFRIFLSHGYRLFVSWSYSAVAKSKCAIQDMQCPFKLIFKSRLQGNYEIAPRFAGDLNFALLYSGPINNMPIHFIHQRGGSIRMQSIFEMFFETLKVVRALRKWRVQNNAHSVIYVVKQQYF